MTVSRRCRGNMTFLVCLSVAIVIALAVGGMMLNDMLFQRARAQYKADGLALSLSAKINATDRIGQINQLEEASRELVFSSRQAVRACPDNDLADLQPLCEQLLQEARSGQALVERERQNQIAVITQDIRDAVSDYNRSEKSSSAFLWLHTVDPEVVRVDLGRIEDVDSNVKLLPAIPELVDFDCAHGYVDMTSKLYKHSINAKLPAPDSDMEYRICALPAYIGKTCAPPRNANPGVFVSYGTIIEQGRNVTATINQIPNALQIVCDMGVSVGSTQLSYTSLRLVSIASASGASSESE